MQQICKAPGDVLRARNCRPNDDRERPAPNGFDHLRWFWLPDEVIADVSASG